MHSDIRKRAAGAYSLSAPLILAVLNTSALRAQLAPPPLFEVASIKPNKSGDVRTSMMPYPEGRLIAENNSLKQLVRAAFGVKDFQISGGPDWFDADRFDIVAKAEGPASKGAAPANAPIPVGEPLQAGFPCRDKAAPGIPLGGGEAGPAWTGDQPARRGRWRGSPVSYSRPPRPHERRRSVHGRAGGLVIRNNRRPAGTG